MHFGASMNWYPVNNAINIGGLSPACLSSYGQKELHMPTLLCWSPDICQKSAIPPFPWLSIVLIIHFLLYFCPHCSIFLLFSLILALPTVDTVLRVYISSSCPSSILALFYLSVIMYQRGQLIALPPRVPLVQSAQRGRQRRHTVLSGLASQEMDRSILERGRRIF